MSNTDTKKVLQNSISAVMLYCVWPANYSNEDYTTILAHEKIRGRLRIQESETWKVKISWWGEKRRMKRKSIYSTADSDFSFPFFRAVVVVLRSAKGKHKRQIFTP